MNKDFLNCLRFVIEKHIPFVAFRAPNKSVRLILDSNPLLAQSMKELEGKKGFIFHPFTLDRHKTIFFNSKILITEENAKMEVETLVDLKSKKEHFRKNISKEISKQVYLESLIGLVEELNSSDLEKLVYSRIKKIKFPNLNFTEFFNQLINDNPKAFVYLLNSPESGCWIGASPERFLSVENGVGQTTALAGTKKKAENRAWTKKEYHEQKIVADFISNALSKSRIEVFEKSDLYDFETGSLLHLKNDFSFKTETNNISQLIEELHPTPAVGGLPKQNAIERILEIENHDRAYYTGFLGELNSSENMNLYVNLRCAQLDDNGLSLFLGGGITGDSNPIDEWEETEAKSKALLSSIEKLQNFD